MWHYFSYHYDDKDKASSIKEEISSTPSNNEDNSSNDWRNKDTLQDYGLQRVLDEKTKSLQRNKRYAIIAIGMH